jgi:predicted transcriptional regulator
MGKWECYRCSYVSEGENPPEECPNCHYSVTFWIESVEEKQRTVKDFMRSNLLKLDASSTVLEAAKLMKQNDASSVLVTVNGEQVGIVTEHDILYKIAAEDLAASRVPLRNVMSTTIFSTDSNTPILGGSFRVAKDSSEAED